MIEKEGREGRNFRANEACFCSSDTHTWSLVAEAVLQLEHTSVITDCRKNVGFSSRLLASSSEIRMKRQANIVVEVPLPSAAAKAALPRYLWRKKLTAFLDAQRAKAAAGAVSIALTHTDAGVRNEADVQYMDVDYTPDYEDDDDYEVPLNKRRKRASKTIGQGGARPSRTKRARARAQEQSTGTHVVPPSTGFVGRVYWTPPVPLLPADVQLSIPVLDDRQRERAELLSQLTAQQLATYAHRPSERAALARLSAEDAAAWLTAHQHDTSRVMHMPGKDRVSKMLKDERTYLQKQILLAMSR